MTSNGGTVVTGAAGFIGELVVDRLKSLGQPVQGVDIVAGRQHPTLHVDVTDPRRVTEVIAEQKPRAIVHLAAVVDDRVGQEVCHAVNVLGTQHLLDAAATYGVERFVHVSSIAALGLDPGPDAGPESPLVFDTGAPYFDTKAAAEALVRETSERGALDCVVVRPGDVYGPRSDPWVRRPLELMRRKSPLLIDGGRGLIAHCWQDNLVDALVLALEHPDAPGGIFQVHDRVDDKASPTTYRDYFERLAAAAGLSLSSIAVPRSLALGIGRGFDFVTRWSSRSMPLSSHAVRYVSRRATYTTATTQALGWKPQVDLDEGMRRLAETLAG